MKIFFITILIFFSTPAFSQYNLDSLWHVWEDNSKPDSCRINAINTYSWYGYLFTQPDSAYYFASLAYDFEKSINDEKAMVKSLNIQGLSFYLRGNYDRGIEIYNTALNLSQNIKYTKGIAQTLNGLGSIYMQKGNYSNAIDYFENSLKHYQIDNDLTGEASIYGNLGIIYKRQGHYALAIEFYNKGLKLHEKLDNYQGMSSTLNNIGIIYHNQNDFENALKYYNESLAIDKELKNKHGESLTLNNIGSVYFDSKQYNKALEYNLESLKIKKAMKDDYGIAASYYNLGNIYKEQGKLDLAKSYYEKCIALRTTIGDKQGLASTMIQMGGIEFGSGNNSASYKWNNEALELSKEIGSLIEIRDAAFNLYQTSKSMNKSGTALEMYELYIESKDSLDREENQKEIIKQEFKISYEKKAAADSVKTVEAKKVTDAELAFTNAQLDKEQTQRYSLYVGVALLVLFGGFIYNRFRVSQNQKEVIETQKKNVDEAYEILEEKNTEILDSIKYAKRIQSAILPTDKSVKESLPNSFIVYKPKDIVAGDFYWLENKKGNVLFAAADCTGHGVPGAMVSVICNNGLNRSVREYGLTDPGKILDMTREIVISEFEKSDEDVKDGMDIALCSLNQKILQFSGAHNPLWIIRNNELIEIKADKQPIGKHYNKSPYTTHTIELIEGDSFYIFSDGYADQFGGEKNKKFKTKEFKKLLLSIQNESMENQKQIIESTFDKWKGELEQLDDICIIGVKV